MTDEEMVETKTQILELLKQLRSEPQGEQRDAALARVAEYAMHGAEVESLGKVCRGLVSELCELEGDERHKAVARLAYAATDALPSDFCACLREVARQHYQWPMMVSFNAGIGHPDVIEDVLINLKLGADLPIGLKGQSWKLTSKKKLILEALIRVDSIRKGKAGNWRFDPDDPEILFVSGVRELPEFGPETYLEWVDYVFAFIALFDPDIHPRTVNEWVSKSKKRKNPEVVIPGLTEEEFTELMAENTVIDRQELKEVPQLKEDARTDLTENHFSVGDGFKDVVRTELKSLSGRVKIERRRERMSDQAG
jgi:hypothetical protein